MLVKEKFIVFNNLNLINAKLCLETKRQKCVRSEVFTFSPTYILDSTLRSGEIDKNLANFFQSFLSPRIIAAAQSLFYAPESPLPKRSNAH